MLSKSIMAMYKKRVFELMYAVYYSTPEVNIVNWLCVLIEFVQLTFYPLRRAVLLPLNHFPSSEHFGRRTRPSSNWCTLHT
jgi:hypothetical protein